MVEITLRQLGFEVRESLPGQGDYGAMHSRARDVPVDIMSPCTVGFAPIQTPTTSCVELHLEPWTIVSIR